MKRRQGKRVKAFKMKDNGLVIAAQGHSADVEVNCLTACQACSAKSLCIGQSQTKGILSVNNPLQANPGDRVTIEIPEEEYSKSLILLFGSLLFAALAGMAAGHFSSALLALPTSTGSILGLFLGILAAGIWLFRRFRKKMNSRLCPTIITIINKGGQYG
jgi:positive regulator of sigma E activity